MTDQGAAPTVFISYSHLDEAWKDRLVRHLRPLADERGFAVWDDRRIGAGEDWEARIGHALATARVGCAPEYGAGCERTARALRMHHR